MSLDRMHPAVAHMSALVETLISEQGAGEKRAANLRWVVRDVQVASELDGFPPAARQSFDHLLTLSTWRLYSNLAESGQTRQRIRRSDLGDVLVPATVNSMRTRASAWNAVAKFLGWPVRFPLPSKVPAGSTIEAWQREVLRRELSSPMNTPLAEATRVRVLAIYGVVLDTRARSGELVDMEVGDLADDLSTISLIRRPQGVDAPLPIRETIRLSGFTQNALRAWLTLRKEKVRHVRGLKDALWVSLRINHAGAARGHSRTPSGMPLQVRGLERSYSRTIRRLNEELAGRESGWRPVPGTVERLRRSISTVEVISLSLAA